MSAPALLFRVDASVAIGIGHAMRCLALAQAWQDAGGRAAFVMAETTASAEKRLLAESCDVVRISVQPGSVEDGRETIRIARTQKADWLVLDGYRFGADYQRSLTSAEFKVLFVDDYGHAEHYFADVVLNQNVSADETLYQSREPRTRLLLGTRYCLLRREFAAWREWNREIPKIGRRVLVTLGGGDQEDLTKRVIQALSLVKREDLEATVVLGGSSPDIDQLCSAAGLKKITPRTDVCNMAELMAKADVAISAAGSTCWELCLLGLPALLIDIAENQKEVARELGRRGCAIHLGSLEDVTAARIADSLESLVESQELRHALWQRSRELVDGGGARRVASILRCGSDLRLRPAGQGDVRMLWEWANDPAVREASFSEAFISWEEHARWFAEKMQSDRCLVLIAEDGSDDPIGQIRFDARSDGDAEVDLSIASGKRGRGLATELITLGVRQFLERRQGARVHAFVKPMNRASVNAFERAAFRRSGIEQVRGNEAIHLVYEEN